MQIKTTIRYLLTLVRMAIIKKSTNNRCWRGCREKGTFLQGQWECKLVQPLWRTVWRFLKKLNIGLPWWLSGKESASQCRENGFDPWVGEIPWRRKWQPTLAFLPGKSHGQRKLVGSSPWSHKRVRQDLKTKQQQVK